MLNYVSEIHKSNDTTNRGTSSGSRNSDNACECLLRLGIQSGDTQIATTDRNKFSICNPSSSVRKDLEILEANVTAAYYDRVVGFERSCAFNVGICKPHIAARNIDPYIVKRTSLEYPLASKSI